MLMCFAVKFLNTLSITRSGVKHCTCTRSQLSILMIKNARERERITHFQNFMTRLPRTSIIYQIIQIVYHLF